MAEVAEGFDLLGQVLQHTVGESVVPIKALDRNLLTAVEATKNLPKLPRAKVLDEVQIGVTDLLIFAEFPPKSLVLRHWTHTILAGWRWCNWHR